MPRLKHARIWAALLTSLLTAAAAIADQAPMVARVYSDYQVYMRKGVHDRIFAELGWPHHKWKNVNVSRLAENLDSYDFLFLHGVYNLANPTDFRPHRDQWLAFLNRGGVIVVAGMQDHPTQWDWIIDLGDDFQFDLKTFKGFQKSSDWTNEESELVFGPVEARWAQFETWSPAWTVTNRNAKGKPIVLYQKVGKGVIVVSTSYLDAFTRASDLDRIWSLARKARRESPVKIADVSWGQMRFGENKATVTLRNHSESARDVDVSLTIFNAHRDPVRQTRVVRLAAGADARLSIDYLLTGGDNEIGLVVRAKEDARIVARTGSRCELLDVWGPLESIRKDLKDAEKSLERLKEWPKGLLAAVSAEHADLCARAETLDKELSQARTGLDELRQTTGAVGARAKLLAARAAGWGTLGFTPKKNDKLAVFATDSLRKIYRDRPWPADTPGNVLAIALARNEYESAQVVIVPLSGALADVRVSCGELQSTGGVIGDVQVRPVADCFLPIDGKEGGWRPDVLLTNAPFDIPDDRLARSVWITVHTAADTPAGDYSGTVTVSAAGAEPAELPVKVTVWNFAVPRKCNLPTQFNFRPNQVATYYFGKNIRYEYWKRFTAPMYHEFVKFLLRYRIAVHPYDDFEGQSKSAIGYLGETRSKPTEKDFSEVLELDFTNYDRHMQLLLDHGQDLLYAGCWLRGTIEQRGAYWKSYLPKMYQHLKEKGWDEKAIVYGYDEVPPDEVPIVKSHYALIKELAPTLRYLLTYHHPESAPGADDPAYADIWVPHGGLYSQKLAAQRARYGQAAWRYIVPGFEIYRPTTDYRSIFWSLWRDRCGGFLYFCTAFWHWSPSPADFNPDGSPRKTFLPKKNDQTGIYHLCYPAGAAPQDGLNASIRLEAIRDGLEDWEYLNMLNGLIERSTHPDLTQVTEAVELFKQIDEGGDPNLLQRRSRVATAIEALGATH